MCMTRDLICLSPTSSCESALSPLSEAGWTVHIARSNDEADRLIETRRIKVGLIPIESVGAAGDAILDGAARFEQLFMHPTEWVALLPPHQQASCWNELLTRHFYDYHTLPVDLDRLLNSLGHAYGMACLLHPAMEPPAEASEAELEMVGTSPVMQTLFRSIRKVAGVDAPVLITGESGTGKELAARAIHERSARATGPFIAVNCGALPASLIQSELFGHEKGAFTGAHERKIGYVESAAGGTLFLDEIGDLPLDLQINLLRFLQEGTLERVGGRDPIHVDVRVIAATHVDLEQAIKDKRFREDLYYRLNVLNLQIPPLRERGQDIEILARYFFRKFSPDATERLRGFSQTSVRALLTHPWPGNVRELINRVRRAMVMCEGRLITPADLGLGPREAARIGISLEEARTRAEAEAIRRTLRVADNNISQAARNLQVSRVTLYRLMDKHRIQV